VQLAAAGIVLVGSVVLSLEGHEDAVDGGTGKRRFRLNKSVFWYMFLSSLFISLSSVVFKLVAQDSAYLPTQFFEYMASVIIGALLFLCNRPARRGFLDILRRHRGQAIGLSGLNEVINLGGVIAMRYAMFLAPIAVVQAISSVQAIFLVVVGVILTLLFPRFIKENIGRKHLLQKVLAIGIMILGTVLLALNTKV
jgi:drug/metabolite transporter (DMT)-like permease